LGDPAAVEHFRQILPPAAQVVECSQRMAAVVCAMLEGQVAAWPADLNANTATRYFSVHRHIPSMFIERDAEHPDPPPADAMLVPLLEAISSGYIGEADAFTPAAAKPGELPLDIDSAQHVLAETPTLDRPVCAQALPSASR
jgi:hypothetical protein